LNQTLYTAKDRSRQFGAVNQLRHMLSGGYVARVVAQKLIDHRSTKSRTLKTTLICM